MKKEKWVTFDLDIPAVIREYAQRFVDGICDHETVQEYSDSVAADLMMPQAKVWVLNEIGRIRSFRHE